MYIPGHNKPLWQSHQQLPFWAEVAEKLNYPNTPYNDLPLKCQITAVMAYLVLAADWGEYNVYHLAEQEIQRFTRLNHYSDNYLDLTSGNLPPDSKLVYNILYRNYCQAFYNRDTHPDDKN